jgi:hypothetical protein
MPCSLRAPQRTGLAFASRPAPAAGRRRALVCRADEGFCRDKVTLSTEFGKVAVDGESTVVFLGAGGQSQEVACRKVRATGWRTPGGGGGSAGVPPRPARRNAHTMQLHAAAQGHSALSEHRGLYLWLQDSYILDAGMAAGLELPFTCRGGICG